MSNEMKKIIKLQEPTFLPAARHKGYICPVCSNGSGRDGDGIMRRPGSEYFHCFKCGLHDDILGLIGKAFDLPDFKDQYAKACDLYGLNTGEIRQPVAPPSVLQVAPDDEEPVDHSLDYRKWNRALNEPGNPGLAYMEARGLSLDTLNKFNVGYVSAWKHPKTEHLKKVPSSPRVIIPTSETSYLARDPRDPNTLSDSQKRYTKSKVGRAHLFNTEALNAESTVFIVEGEIDAMSISEVGGAAVGLGSASNKHAFIELVKDSHPKARLVLLPDNDEPGKKAAAEIAEALKGEGFDVKIANIFGKYKDANEMLVNERGLFKTRISILSAPKTTGGTTSSIKEIDECNRALLSLLNLHERHRKCLEGKGLTQEQIAKFAYRSIPSSPKSVCVQLKRHGCTLEGNPLFCKDNNGQWTMDIPSSGILAPARNSRGQIQGFEVITEDGTKTLSKVHFRLGMRGVSEAVILDSVVEADIVSALSGYSVFAVPEDFSQKIFGSALKALQKRGLNKVRLSYDLWADMSGGCSDARKKVKGLLQYFGIQYTEMKKVPDGIPLDAFLLQSKMKKSGGVKR